MRQRKVKYKKGDILELKGDYQNSSRIDTYVRIVEVLGDIIFFQKCSYSGGLVYANLNANTLDVMNSMGYKLYKHS